MEKFFIYKYNIKNMGKKTYFLDENLSASLLSKLSTTTPNQFIYNGTYSETIIDSKGNQIGIANGFNAISKLPNPSTNYSVKTTEILTINSGKFKGSYSSSTNYNFDSFDSSFTTTNDIYYPVSEQNAGTLLVKYDYTVTPVKVTIQRM